TAHQAGVAALRHHWNILLGAQPDHLSDLLGIGRAHHGKGLPLVTTAPIGKERRGVGAGQDIGCTDGALQRFEQVHERADSVLVFRSSGYLKTHCEASYHASHSGYPTSGYNSELPR